MDSLCAQSLYTLLQFLEEHHAGIIQVLIVDADDRLEQSGIDFHRRVYDGYVRMAEKFPDHFVRVNADRGIDEVFAEILDTLRQKGVIR